MTEDEATIAALITDHRGIIVRVARSFADGYEDQEDLIQDILLRIWAARASFRGEAKGSTWMYRVALNQALTWQRGERKRRRNQQQLIELPDRVSDDAAESERRLDELYGMIRSLPHVDRSLVLLSLDGFSYREIGEIVGITETNVGARLSRARSRIKTTARQQTSTEPGKEQQ